MLRPAMIRSCHTSSGSPARPGTSHRSCLAVAVVLVVVSLAACLHAAPTTAYQARQVVRGWLQLDASPLQTSLGHQIDRVDTFTDAEDQPAWYVVYLQPAGFVVVAADDEVEPIVAFAADGSFDMSTDNPLQALVKGDMTARLRAVRHSPAHGRAVAQQTKWQRLAGSDAPGDILYGLLTDVSDVRVPPLVQSRWGQGNDGESYCYNYSTPNHYPAGCVATAMAQLMRYFQYPTTGIGRYASTISVNGTYQGATTRGGDGEGGPYNWSQMPLDPDATLTTQQRQAIGALCYDAGVSVNMKYASSTSSATTLGVSALVWVFGYANAIAGKNYGSSIPTADLTLMINPNLDAAIPVLLGISGSAGAHAVVCDGYGYTGATLYHHLNMGWTGGQDAWYNLPIINSSPSFTVIFECAYNIFPGAVGEIISGRLLGPNGAPVAAATVTANLPDRTTVTATSNIRGIYALVGVPSASTCTIRVTAAGLKFDDRVAETGTSLDYEITSGNLWSVDFTGQPAAILVGDINHDGYVNVGDLQLLVAAWGSNPQAGNWNVDADLNRDGFINVGDLQLLVEYWGT